MIENWTKPLESLIPMWGNAPAFPWKDAGQLLGQLLKSEVKLNAGIGEWKEGSALVAGLGENPTAISLELSPLKEPLFLVMPKSDVEKLTTSLMGERGPGLKDPSISTAFFQYALLEMLSQMADLRPLGDLVPQLADHTFEPGRGYALDVAIEREGQTLWLRLICPEDFHKAFKTHFANQKIDLFNHPMADKVQVALTFEIGETTLSAAKWKSVGLGDFVILDRCSYDPNTAKGSMIVSCAGGPLFQARAKEGELKILDYAYTFEETAMNDDEEDLMDIEEESPPPTHTEHQDLISADNVPLQIIVEVGRVHMPLSKVLGLKPGNVLDLSMRPEEGVTLTVSGKAIAKGQLLAVGDVLGVKITDVG
ncbi:MAG: type III secretion system cytoplasmic ring protein SctQ [Chlamydiia bacterium]|nr:type III secretion system cytoplasmic ring protein SctQ [Chlamydiia bacterium]MCP5509245.1 type III secretion system cytoplasmic ring protein SctQ [Chlamydiales bacterium]